MHRVLIIVLAVCAISAFAASAARTHRFRLRARRKVHGLQRDAAGGPWECAAQLVAGRSLLVPRHNRPGHTIIVVDAGTGARTPAFDHSELAAALSSAAGTAFDSHRLAFTEIEFSDDRQSVSFNAEGKRWKCARAGSQCVAENAARRSPRVDAPSPDKKRTAFIRDYNLWVRDVATGKETQLTTDGVKDFGYATDNAGWTAQRSRRSCCWSPDSKKIATFQQDQRGVGEMYLVETEVGHPKLQAWKYPLPGDDSGHDDPARDHRCRRSARRAAADAARPAPLDAVRRHRLPRRRVGRRAVERRRVRSWRSSPRRATTSGSSCASPTRRPARCATCSKRRSPTYFESGNGRVNWRYLPESNEIIWFSERDNWGQLYLYDLRPRAS